MALPIAAGMFGQMLRFLVDLYFVAALNAAALGMWARRGTLLYADVGPTRVLGAGAVALTSRATRRGDRTAGKLVLNQALLLATLCVVASLSDLTPSS
jgi:Na+-driven multidrug efflux pump